LYRNRIEKEFDDGDSCKVTLKDRFVEPTEEQQLWYDRAFGKLKNKMKIKVIFRPTKIKDPLQFEYYIQLTYKMFEEMHMEFDPNAEEFKSPSLHQLEQDEELEDIIEFQTELERPFGHYETALLYKKKDAKEDEEGGKLIQLKEDWVDDYFQDNVEPEPISREM
jgi:hypothetical protein